MAIVLPAGLPAALELGAEGVRVLDTDNAPRAPDLRVGLVNLMPNKTVTELQFARLLGGGGRTVALSLLCMATHAPRHGAEHVARFYRPWSDPGLGPLDGLIVTGAPVEHLPFEAVDYWTEFRDLLDWAEVGVGGSLFVCWAAQAALRHRHGVPKRPRKRKAFGVYPQQVAAPESALLRGLGPVFPVPVSRHSEVAAADLPAGAGLRVLAANPETGPCLIEDRPRRAVYMSDHLEYGPDTLRAEYLRDRLAGLAVAPPVNDPADPQARRRGIHPWRAHAELFFRNWLNQLPANERGGRLAEGGSARAAPATAAPPIAEDAGSRQGVG